MFAVAALCGGVWGAAGVEALRGDVGKPAVYWVFMVYRHMVQPTRLRIGRPYAQRLPSQAVLIQRCWQQRFWPSTVFFKGCSSWGEGQMLQCCCWCLRSRA
jgi:hypothetical protein